MQKLNSEGLILILVQLDVRDISKFFGNTVEKDKNASYDADIVMTFVWIIWRCYKNVNSDVFLTKDKHFDEIRRI